MTFLFESYYLMQVVFITSKPSSLTMVLNSSAVVLSRDIKLIKRAVCIIIVVMRNKTAL